MSDESNPYAAPRASGGLATGAGVGNKDFRRNVGLMRFLVGILLAGVLVEMVSVWSSYRDLVLWKDDEVSQEAYDEFNAMYEAFSVGYTVFGLVLFVVFLVWLNRVSKNAWEMDEAGAVMRITPRWAVGWHFVPIAFWWKPYQAVREVVTASYGRVAMGVLLPVWWVANLVEWGGGVYFARMGYETVSEMEAALSFEYWLSGVVVVRLILTAVIVFRVTRRQEEWVAEEEKRTVARSGFGFGR